MWPTSYLVILRSHATATPMTEPGPMQRHTMPRPSRNDRRSYSVRPTSLRWQAVSTQVETLERIAPNSLQLFPSSINVHSFLYRSPPKLWLRGYYR